jgi:hypothetical protein
MCILQDQKGVELIEIDVKYPITEDDLVSRIEEAIFVEKSGRIKLALIDAISSNPGIYILTDPYLNFKA